MIVCFPGTGNSRYCAGSAVRQLGSTLYISVNGGYIELILDD